MFAVISLTFFFSIFFLFLSAQGTPELCSAPTLLNVFFNEYKPAVERAESVCRNGQWSPQPLCIACTPPSLTNAKYKEDSKFWYEYGSKKKIITCNKVVPVCESIDYIYACTEPPDIPYAVIINQEHQEVFPVDSELTYQCQDDYVTEEGAKNKSIFCITGNWTESPTCSKEILENCGEFPIVENGLVEKSEPLALTVKCQHYYKLYGPEKVVCYNSNKWSVIPTCKGKNYDQTVQASVKSPFTIFSRYFICINGKATVSRCKYAV
uniref:Sushi domain-containing protein n=1 Tax=Oryzias latipes TaxID=8090 RepID=A0A3P9IVJ6_ORYLA